MSKLISNPTFDMGSFYYEKGLKKQFEFKFDDLSNLHYFYLGCGSCTTITKIDKETNTIKGFVDIDSAIGSLKDSIGEHSISKYLSVKFDPEKPEFIADEIGKRIFNTDIVLLHLTIKFLVRVVDPKIS